MNDPRLNPLSTGKSVQTNYALAKKSLNGFNPLSTGKSVQTAAKQLTGHRLRLNPLSTGKSVQTQAVPHIINEFKS